MIGWYVHHQGRGHLTRARVIRDWLDEPVTVLSSLGQPPDSNFAGWVQLARDDDVERADGIDPAAVDPTANGLLHWVPRTSAGLSRRMAQLAEWIADNRPTVMVVDVSVEVTVLARLCGIPVVVIAGPGDRTDDAHQLGFGLAEKVIAAWPREVYDPPFLHPHRHKCVYVGAISRFDERIDARRDAVGRDVFVLNGAGGTTVTPARVAAASRSTPGLVWTAAGLPGQPWCEDVWTSLLDAGVVITHAGQNALADVAAARRAAVIVPQARPFAEQVRVAAALGAAGIAVTAAEWPSSTHWPALIEAALAVGGNGWKRWSSGDSAARAAAVIARVGR